MKCAWTAALLLSATGLLAAAGPARSQDDAPPKAETIVNTACTSCHDIRTIQTQALDAPEWEKIVNSMIQDKGATVNKDDIPMLVSYLADVYGPLPDGEGKEIVLNKCTVCHDLMRVRQHLATPEEWYDTLGAMENEGLMISQEDFVTVLKYLAKNFRAQ